MTKEKKELEYPDAPSGYVTLYNYKEPFMKFEGGFGFQGVLLFDGESDKVQCHFCGQWFISLPQHVAAEHNMKAYQYKKSVGLGQNTALISESMRAKLIAIGLDKRLQNLRNQKGRVKTEEEKKKISEGLKRWGKSLEHKNQRGTCPEQLIDRLLNEYKRLGRTPEIKKLPFREALVNTYGSFKEACKVANIPYREPGVTITHSTAWTRKEVIEFYSNFFKKEQRFPKSKEQPEAMRRYVRKYGKSKFKADVLAQDGIYKKNPEIVRYSKENLLEFLRRFESIHNRKPSYSDSKRGLLPHLSRYSYNFGSWKNALKQAFN